MADTHKYGGHAHIRGVGQGLRHAGCLFTFFILYVAYFVYARTLPYVRGRRPFLAPATNLAGVYSSGPSIVVDLRYYFRDVCWRIGMVRSEEPKLYI